MVWLCSSKPTTGPSARSRHSYLPRSPSPSLLQTCRCVAPLHSISLPTLFFQFLVPFTQTSLHNLTIPAKFTIRLNLCPSASQCSRLHHRLGGRLSLLAPTQASSTAVAIPAFPPSPLILPSTAPGRYLSMHPWASSAASWIPA